MNDRVELVWRHALASDPDPGTRAQRPGGNRVIEAQNSAVIRLAIDDDLDTTEIDTLLRCAHRNQRCQAAGLGCPEKPAWGRCRIIATDRFRHVGTDGCAVRP